MVTTPSRKSVYNIHNPVGAKILSRLRLGLSQLTKHKFDHNFETILNPTFSCSLPHEFVSHFSLDCLHSRDNRRSLFNELEKADIDNLGLPDNEITLYFFYMNILIIMQNSNSKIWQAIILNLKRQHLEHFYFSVIKYASDFFKTQKQHVHSKFALSLDSFLSKFLLQPFSVSQAALYLRKSIACLFFHFHFPMSFLLDLPTRRVHDGMLDGICTLILFYNSFYVNALLVSLLCTLFDR